MSFNIDVLKDFAIFTGKHLCWNLFLIKIQAWRPATLLKKRLQHRCFPVNVAKFLITATFIEDLWRQLLEFTRNIDRFFDFLNPRHPFAKSFKPTISNFNFNIQQKAIESICKHLLKLKMQAINCCTFIDMLLQSNP